MPELIERPTRTAIGLVVALAVVVVLLHVYWPAGVLFGGVVGIATVVQLGRAMQAQAASTPHDGRLPFDGQAEPVMGALPAIDGAEASAAVEPASASFDVLLVAAAARASGAAAPAEPDTVRVVADADAHRPEAVAPAEIAGVRVEPADLKARLGDAYPDFARAAAFVVATQYASAARLQRELQVPYARARRLLTDLEAQHIVGPPTGPTPRQVLLPKDHLADLERLLAAA